jgi:hypothetical protein
MRTLAALTVTVSAFLGIQAATTNSADAHGWCGWRVHCCGPCGYHRPRYRAVRHTHIVHYAHPIPAFYFPVPPNYYRDEWWR